MMFSKFLNILGNRETWMLLPVKRNDGLLQCTSRQKEENQLYVQRSRTELFGGFYLKILASNFQKQICKKKKMKKEKKFNCVPELVFPFQSYKRRKLLWRTNNLSTAGKSGCVIKLYSGHTVFVEESTCSKVFS